MNARAETIADKPIFRDAYRKRRGVVPIDAFHQKDAKGKLHMIKRADGEPLAIAAIWKNWKNPHTGQWERTFATIMVSANAAVASVHDRMPLIIEKQDLDRWLGTEEDPRDLLQPSADGAPCMKSLSRGRTARALRSRRCSPPASSRACRDLSSGACIAAICSRRHLPASACIRTA
jgi:putative SOS response-associated peptidase YedK